jgi:adenylate cyclase class 2
MQANVIRAAWIILTAMRSGSREIEIKFRVLSIPALLRKLRAARFRQLTARTHEENALYDFPRQQLRQRGELLRLRKYGKHWTITHKARARVGRHKSRVETESCIENGEAVQRIFAALGLAPVFRYEKFRSEWSDGYGHVVVDETPIGNFAEIEGSPRWIDRTAAMLGVKPSEYITQNYAALFLEWKKARGSKARQMLFKV